MVFPGPAALGRSAVISPGGRVPPEFAEAERLCVDGALLDDRARLAATVDVLHRAWVARVPVVVELAAAEADLRASETDPRPAWELGAGFTFLRERLQFLVWANAWDLRGAEPVWWWAAKAEAAGALRGGRADVLLPDGSEAFVDGGPRGPVPGLEAAIVHAESVHAGRLTPAPAARDRAAAGLAPDQREAALHAAGPARIIAPAGSGKTRTLVARLRHLLVDRQVEPQLVCAVAYNARAARELRERVGSLPGLSVRTIHSLGWEILREARGDLRLLDEREQRRRLDPLVEAARRPNVDVVGPYLEALGDIRVGLRPPPEVEAARDDVPGLVETVARYRAGLLRAGEADHDEQIAGAIEVLASDATLRRRWQERCRHLLVDEFQDLTPGYLLLLRLVASPGLDVFAVGDDDQTIYGYAGADPGYLIDFERFFPGAGSHALEINYRCPAPVVTAAASLLGYNRRRIGKAVRPAERAAADPAALTVEPADGPDLAAICAARVGERIAAGVEPGDMAVLCRVNAALLPVHAALADRAVPMVSVLDAGVLERTVLRAALAWMRIALDVEQISRADLLEAVRRPSRGLSRLAVEVIGRRRVMSLGQIERLGASLDDRRADRWQRFCDDLAGIAAVAHRSTAGIVDFVVDRVGLDRAAAALDSGRTRADRSAQSDDLVALRRAASLHPEPADFETWLRAALARPSNPDGVLLTTVHRVKGMEWKEVFVYGADRGLFPHDLATDWEEERRVFHVALTRAVERVTVLADRARPSPFLAEMAGTAARAAAPPRQPTAAAAIAAAGAGVAADPDLVDRLKRWRLDVARARKVPAYVVLHDSTIDEIARRRPRSEGELARVPGIGPAKLEAFGDDLIALVGDA